jgi:hypothetical protein
MTNWVDKFKGDGQNVQRSKILGTRVIAEMTSTSAMLGAAYVLDNVYEAKPVKNVLSKVISPFIAPFDWGADRLPALENDQETQHRKNSSRDERAYIYADALVDLGAKVATNLTVQFATTQLINDQLLGKDAPSMADTGLSMAADRAVNWGSIFILNTIFPEQNENMQNMLKPMIQKVTGIDEKNATMLARDAINLHIPNMAGALTSLAVLFNSTGKSR